MGREIIQNSMIDSLETILSLVANINSKNGVIPQIDIDLLKQHIRKLYQDVHYLDEENQKWKNEPRKFRDEKIMQREENVPMREESEPPVINQSGNENESVEKEEAEIPVAEEKIEAVVEEPRQEIIPEEEIKEEEPEEETEIEEEVDEEPLVVQQEEETPKIEEVKADVHVEKEPALFDEPISLADKFGKEEKSINEKLSEGNTNKAVHQNAQSTPVSNLKTAIGINDKFMFVNELFQGDMKSYDAFIREVNDMNNGAAALNAYSQKLESLGADDESAAAVKLGEYIERRFL